MNHLCFETPCDTEQAVAQQVVSTCLNKAGQADFAYASIALQ